MSAAQQDLERAAALNSTSPTVRLVRGDTVTLEPVLWLWDGYLPAGMLTILGGSPGTGKTTLALAVAAVLTRGGRWPDGSRCHEAGDVLIWSGEDCHSVTAARLVASDADMQRVHFIDGISGSEGEAFDPGRDMALLEAKALTLQAPRLLILDPIVSAVAGDSHKGAEVRRSLQPVVDLAQRLGCAVLGITHFSKGTTGRDPAERITGSIAFAALARLVLVAAKVQADEGGEPRRVLVRAKSNVGPDDGGFSYSLDRVEVASGVEGQRVIWGDVLQGSARDVLAEAEADNSDEDSGEASAKEAAEQFLRELLTGPMPAKTVKSEALEAGHSWATVRRAANALNVFRKKTGMDGGWYWSLPEGAQKTPKVLKVLTKISEENLSTFGAPSAETRENPDPLIEPSPRENAETEAF